jgi:hypothetical protein
VSSKHEVSNLQETLNELSAVLKRTCHGTLPKAREWPLEVIRQNHLRVYTGLGINDNIIIQREETS